MHPEQTGPETHVSQVKGFGLNDIYFQGVGAFRNAHELARDLRTDLIKSSNSKAQAEKYQP